jgi:hypothetical protein
LFNRSFDGGATWLSNEIEVSNSPGGWNYYNIPGIFRSPGLPFVACDNSKGAHRGTVYINWQDQRSSAGNTDIWLSRSTDSGSTWSAPIKVNDDTTHKHHFMSSMTVDQATGYIYVLFYDRRNYAYTDSATDVYLAVSKDGAASFQNFKISAEPFTPQGRVFFGDYTCVTAYNNTIRAVWAAQVTLGYYECDAKIITALIDSSILGVAINELVPQSCSLQVYPNPYAGHATLFYHLPVSGPVSLFITDCTGRNIATIRDHEFMPEGDHTDLFHGNISPGMYYVNMTGVGFSKTIKLVNIR